MRKHHWPTFLTPLGVLCHAVQVRLLEGDLNSDDLGLSAADQAKVLSEVEFVVHSAASIELEADVQHTLRSNYLGTQRLLRMATRITRLRCFLHVSTAYVNVNQPRGSSVEERIYRLKLGKQPISHAEIVEDLLRLEPDDANCRVRTACIHVRYAGVQSASMGGGIAHEQLSWCRLSHMLLSASTS